MERREVPYTHGLEQMLEALRGGGLLLAAAKPDGSANVMTIGWATVGIIWGKPIYTVLVRPSRHTYGFMEAAGCFTVNVPTPELRAWADFCGTKSGRDVDKFAALGMATSPALKVRGMTIDACPLVYECQVVHHNDVIPAHLAPAVAAGSYPGGDYHRIYYGEILGVYASE